MDKLNNVEVASGTKQIYKIIISTRELFTLGVLKWFHWNEAEFFLFLHIKHLYYCFFPVKVRTDAWIKGMTEPSHYDCQLS